MKRSIILIATLCALIFPMAYSNAQTSDASTITPADVELSLNIARNILKAASGIANDFADFKGDFVRKSDSGNSWYMAKGLEMGTGLQYVIVRPNGGVSYAVIFNPKDESDKTPLIAFTAFVGGIITIRQNDDITVEQDPAGTQGTTIKYFLKAKDIKVASFSFDTGTKSGTLLVAIQ